MILEQIKGPEDLKKLTSEELSQLAEEIRAFLIEKISHTGGHLASNLGVVELTIALFRTFDLPEDKIIWDVGHQSYIHKIRDGASPGISLPCAPMAASAVFQNAAKILVMRLERGMPAPLFQQPLAWPVPVIYLVMITMSLLSSGMGP